jgi:hypothetical protein
VKQPCCRAANFRNFSAKAFEEVPMMHPNWKLQGTEP